MPHSFTKQYRFEPLHLLPFAAGLMVMIWMAWPGRFFFLNDDFIHIPLADKGIFGHRKSIRYLGDFSLWLDAKIWGTRAWGFHFTNLCLHIVNGLLLAVITHRLCKKTLGNLHHWFVIYTTLLFAFFAFKTDVLCWVIGRSASLGTFFLLLTVYWGIKFQQGILFRLLFACSWVAALFAYESVWIYPLVLIAAIVFLPKPYESNLKPNRIQAIIVMVLFALYLAIRKWITGSMLGTYEAAAFENPAPLTLLTNYAKLLFRTFVPPDAHHIRFIISGLVAIALYGALVTYLFRKKQQNALWGFLHVCWLFSYVPYLSLGISATTAESERFLYLPSLLFSVCVVFSVYKAFAKWEPITFHVICTLFLSYHIFFLSRSIGTYEAAGNLSRTSMQLLKQQQPFSSIEVFALPKTMEGIPLFRDGFSEGVAWLIDPGIDIVVKDSMQDATAQSTVHVQKTGKVVQVIFKKQP